MKKVNAGGFSTGEDAARQNKPDEKDATSASRCAFHKSLARAAPCLQTGKQTHPGELTVKTHLCLLPFNFLPHTQTDAARPARFHGWMQIHSKKPPSSPTIHLCCTHTHTHTHTSQTNDFNTSGANRGGSPLQQTILSSAGIRGGREGGQEGGRGTGKKKKKKK